MNTHRYWLLVSLFLFAGTLIAQTPNYHWIKGVNTSEIVEVSFDGYGNVYTAGHFNGNLTIGGTTLNSGGGLSIFLVKRDINGDVLWVRSFGGSAPDIVKDLKVDHLGYVYMTGNTRSAMTVGGTTFNANQYGDFFLLKYAPNGNLVYAISSGTTSGEGGEGIGLDAQGNVYVAFYMGNTFSLAGLTVNSLNGNSTGVAKFSPTGQILWAQNYGREFDYNSCRDIAVLPNGDHYLLGQYSGSVIFGTDTLEGVDDTWVARFDSSGAYQWSRNLEGPDFDVWYAVGAAPNGDLYLVGDYYDTLQIGGTTYVSQGQNDLIFTKYDATGTLLFHSVYGTAGAESAQSVAVAANGDFYVTGEYSAGCNLGAGGMNTFGFTDIFLAKFDASGNNIWVETGGTQSFDRGLDVACDPAGRVYGVGYCQATFGPPFVMGGYSISSIGAYTLKILETANHIGGRVAMDFNFNGIYEATDLPWNGGQINMTPGFQSTLTDFNGEYNFVADTGTYTLQMPTIPNYYSLTPSTHSASFPALGQFDTTNYFLLEPTPGITDVRVSIVPLSPARPGQEYWLRVFYQNVGTDTAAGTVSLEHPFRVAYEFSNPPYTSQIADTLYWNYANLLPWETRSVLVKMRPDTLYNIGQSISLIAHITPYNTDADQLNNRDTLVDFISNSYDPNDKLVTPAGPFTSAQAAPGLDLTYTIRFQNTGNDTAFVVRLIDTLGANLRPETFEMVQASHPYTLELRNGIATWRFDQILLPDSATDPAGSMGFVQFKMKTVTGMQNGTTVENFADIYFDYNAPIRTPVAEVRIQDGVGITDRVEIARNFTVFPNPNQGECWIKTDRAIQGKVQFSLWDLQGRFLWFTERNQMQENETLLLQTEGLSRGTYFLQIQHGSGVEMQKVVVND